MYAYIDVAKCVSSLRYASTCTSNAHARTFVYGVHPAFYGIHIYIWGSLDSHRLSYTRDHHVRNEHAHRSLDSTLVHKIKTREVGDTHIKFRKAVWTLSKLGLSLHGVADPHRKGQLRHTTPGIISPDTIVEKPLALRDVTLCGCHYN